VGVCCRCFICVCVRSHARFLCFSGFFWCWCRTWTAVAVSGGGVGYDEFARSVAERGRVWFVCGG
jgi:hypothetical protein